MESFFGTLKSECVDRQSLKAGQGQWPLSRFCGVHTNAVRYVVQAMYLNEVSQVWINTNYLRRYYCTFGLPACQEILTVFP
jgi:transposase InsO family protein